MTADDQTSYKKCMQYSAWMTYDWPKPVLELAESDFNGLIFSWRGLAAVANIEDLWEIIVQNYVDLESNFMKSALHSMVRDDGDHGFGQDERLKVARILSNLLSSCRSYLYQVPRHLAAANSEGAVTAFRDMTHREYDSCPSYAFMEALRNHAQHYGLPLHGTTIGGRWSFIETEHGLEKGSHRFSASATITLDRLRSDPDFKKSVLAQFQSQDSLDIVRLTREYIEALSRIHEDLRQEMSESVAGWKSKVRTVLARYAKEAGCRPHFVMIGEFLKNEPGRGVQIFEDLLVRVEQMVRRNRPLVNLPRRYVTTELG